MATTRPLGRRILDRVVGLLDVLVPPRSCTAIHSSPDLDDSIVALLASRPNDLDVVVLAEDPAAAAARLAALGLEGVRLVPRRSPRGTWAYLRSQVLVSTHGMFGSRPRGGSKQVVGLWHGEFGKLIGTFTGEAPRYFDWVPVSSPLSRSLRSAEFALDPHRIQVVGSPRQRLLLGGGRQRSLARGEQSRRVVVWAPTYRTSVSGMIRSDGDPEALEHTLPLDDPDLLDLLDRHRATLWYRAHPAASQRTGRLVSPFVRSAANSDLESLGITFYELLAEADCFITDYSSLWVDFVLCDRPLVAFCPDLDRYRDDRGLALEPHETWFPGPVTTSRAGLLSELAHALEHPASGAESRSHSRAVLHTSTCDPVTATWQHVRAVISGRG